MFEILKRNKRKKRLPKSMKTLISREMCVSRRKIFVGTQYLTPIKEKDFHEFLVADMTDKVKWEEGAWECDAFALNLLASAKMWFYNKYKKNAAAGMVWRAGTGGQKGHAINFIVTPELEIRYFEPQKDVEVFLVGRKLFVLI
jgi:hypothetical protein